MMHGSSISLIPPGTGGVRDYATVLARQLDAPLLELTPGTDTALLSGDVLLLHFSGYGFQKRGVPLWLVKKVRDLRTRYKAFGIVFHELFASGPPWGSAFWLSPCQRRIARDLLLLADFWLTSREKAAHWLLGHSRAAPHRILPVFSTVGEPPPIDTARQRKLIVFGSSGIRAPVYQWADGEIFRFAKRNGLEIHDIGAESREPALVRRLAEEGVVTHGMLPAAQVSLALSGATYGAVVYPADYASKSSVFAAYCSHGLCPILLSKDYQIHDGLKANVQYVAGFDAVDKGAIDPCFVGSEARTWYGSHSIDTHVAALRKLATQARR